MQVKTLSITTFQLLVIFRMEKLTIQLKIQPEKEQMDVFYNPN